ncbi:YaiI/YqxD family protein [Listeria cossartiae subsp. cayugensis]|uniref:YaiI/YqxD family protein n=1 Tax=Listeria cossartiae TaxID=2838249 RepID=UPI0028806281|nr:YaiI/YqxD family protein [Listeria cossartiae]MDS9999872.1 YaiI/YqxD family protein [Listeria cossartiae subsp. cayugensis]MDT0007681.1 YaiI/YqxD family protein [Listeria cossartiae subsp. cayugensis]MDT0029904.1 YaiI/YqxD family protein [Listeria cossartiae subsp. cayugensis]MDT0038019.1 YaiI/YqxD family protein [Listeria cossartiae subsp. cayugensis]MDT0043369.1 YaiI/YqxD family protein [Listeria cossartiae subsp. cayugensis]
MPQILVDADACPVKTEIKQVAKEFQLEVTFVASFNHYSVNTNGEKWIFVDTGKESADMRMMNLAKKGDIIVTQDIGLASILLAKGTFVFSNRGELYREEEMSLMLDIRYRHAKERQQGKYSKGPKAMSDADRSLFQDRLTTFLQNK